MKVPITGEKGFVGIYLIATLSYMMGVEILPFDVDTYPALLDEYTRECGFVYHLAGVNRPQRPDEFMADNFGLYFPAS